MIRPAAFILYAFLSSSRSSWFWWLTFQCADIQFSASASYSQPSSCKNNTGISAVSFPGKLHANQSTGTGEPQSESSGGGGHHGSQSTSTAGAVPLQTAAWGMLGAAVAGGVAVL